MMMRMMTITVNPVVIIKPLLCLGRYFAEHDKATALQMLNDSLQPKHKYVDHLCSTPDTLKDTLQAYLKSVFARGDCKSLVFGAI